MQHAIFVCFLLAGVGSSRYTTGYCTVLYSQNEVSYDDHDRHTSKTG